MDWKKLVFHPNACIPFLSSVIQLRRFGPSFSNLTIVFSCYCCCFSLLRTIWCPVSVKYQLLLGCWFEIYKKTKTKNKWTSFIQSYMYWILAGVFFSRKKNSAFFDKKKSASNNSNQIRNKCMCDRNQFYLKPLFSVQNVHSNLFCSRFRVCVCVLHLKRLN